MSVSMISVKRALQFTSATGIAYGLRFVPQLPRACANRIGCANCIALHCIASHRDDVAIRKEPRDDDGARGEERRFFRLTLVVRSV